MANDSSTKNRDALKRIAEEIEKDAPEAERAGREIVRSARDAQDVAGIYRGFAEKIPNDDVLSDEHWKRTLDSLAAVRDHGKGVVELHAPFRNYSVTVSAATTTANSFFSSIGPLPSGLQPFYIYGKAELDRITGRHGLMNEVCVSMRHLDLHRISGRRSPLELLEDAKSAIDQPQTTTADQPVAALIPLRESILSTIAELLRRRRKQEDTKRVEKIVSIGNQCGLDGLPEGHFDRLAADSADLLKKLSATKQKTMPRDEIIGLFNEGLNFLKSFTQSIDETKLRP